MEIGPGDGFPCISPNPCKGSGVQRLAIGTWEQPCIFVGTNVVIEMGFQRSQDMQR